MIKKAVIPAAGFGTRFLPITKSMPKEMLPVIDKNGKLKPVIHFVVEEIVNAGIRDIIIVTARGKRAVEDYFDASPELENHLIHKNKELLKEINLLNDLTTIHYVRQNEPKGLGDAILRTEKHIGNEYFAIILGDTIYDKPILKEMICLQKKERCSVIAVEKVSKEHVSKYGIVKIRDNMILDLVEKPEITHAPSNLAICGSYILSPKIFECLRNIRPGYSNELQLTDGIKLLLGLEKVIAYRIPCKRYDIGDPKSWMETNLELWKK